MQLQNITKILGLQGVKAQKNAAGYRLAGLPYTLQKKIWQAAVFAL